MVIGTVKGDLHDIGKNLVAVRVEGAGFDVIDMGTNDSPEEFCDEIRKHDPAILGLSALLITTVQNMKSTIDALREMGVREHVKVLIGGAPITEAFAESIGADGFASDASRAVTLVKKLLKS